MIERSDGRVQAALADPISAALIAHQIAAAASSRWLAGPIAPERDRPGTADQHDGWQIAAAGKMQQFDIGNKRGVIRLELLPGPRGKFLVRAGCFEAGQACDQTLDRRFF